jgi:hypothetical protein
VYVRAREHREKNHSPKTVNFKNQFYALEFRTTQNQKQRKQQRTTTTTTTPKQE